MSMFFEYEISSPEAAQEKASAFSRMKAREEQDTVCSRPQIRHGTVSGHRRPWGRLLYLRQQKMGLRRKFQLGGPVLPGLRPLQQHPQTKTCPPASPPCTAYSVTEP